MLSLNDFIVTNQGGGLQQFFNQLGYINTYFASEITGIISVQFVFVVMSEVHMFLQCRGDIEGGKLSSIHRIVVYNVLIIFKRG